MSKKDSLLDKISFLNGWKALKNSSEEGFRIYRKKNHEKINNEKYELIVVKKKESRYSFILFDNLQGVPKSKGKNKIDVSSRNLTESEVVEKTQNYILDNPGFNDN